MVLAPDMSAWLAEVTGAERVHGVQCIQSLWSGYGELFRADLINANVSSGIVRWVRPPESAKSARASESDKRKRRSYAVEAAFYRTYAARCSATCRVPGFIATKTSTTKSDERVLVLEDLDAVGYPERRRVARASEIDA